MRHFLLLYSISFNIINIEQTDMSKHATDLIKLHNFSNKNKFSFSFFFFFNLLAYRKMKKKMVYANAPQKDVRRIYTKPTFKLDVFI